MINPVGLSTKGGLKGGVTVSGGMYDGWLWVAERTTAVRRRDVNPGTSLGNLFASALRFKDLGRRSFELLPWFAAVVRWRDPQPPCYRALA